MILGTLTTAIVHEENMRCQIRTLYYSIVMFIPLLDCAQDAALRICRVAKFPAVNQAVGNKHHHARTCRVAKFPPANQAVGNKHIPWPLQAQEGIQVHTIPVAVRIILSAATRWSLHVVMHVNTNVEVAIKRP